ncbi:hypothetical protein ABIA96_007345 [Bradyrhizobium sp. LB11.1]
MGLAPPLSFLTLCALQQLFAASKLPPAHVKRRGGHSWNQTAQKIVKRIGPIQLERAARIDRQVKLKNRAGTVIGDHRYFSFMRFDDRPADGQSHAHTVCLGRKHWVEYSIL